MLSILWIGIDWSVFDEEPQYSNLVSSFSCYNSVGWSRFIASKFEDVTSVAVSGETLQPVRIKLLSFHLQMDAVRQYLIRMLSMWTSKSWNIWELVDAREFFTDHIKFYVANLELRKYRLKLTTPIAIKTKFPSSHAKLNPAVGRKHL